MNFDDLPSKTDQDLNINKKSTRDRLFYTIHHLLLFKEITPKFGSILIGIQYLQIILLTLSNNNKYVFNALNSTNIAIGMDYLEAITLFPVLLKSGSPSLYLMIFIICCIIISLITIGTIIFTHIEDFENIRIQQAAYYMGIFLEISNKILLIPLCGVLLLSFKCDQQIFDGCFNYNQIIIGSIAAIFLIIYLTLQYIIETFFFVFSFKTKDSFSRAPSKINVITLFHKIFAIFLFIFIYSDQYSSIYGIYHILLGILLLDNFLTKIPFFNDDVSKTYGISISIYVWVNCCLILVDLVPLDMLRANILVLIGVGIIYFCNLIMNTRSLLVKSLTIKDANEITNDIYLDSKIRLFFKLAKESQSENTAELLLASLMRIHADKCLELKCPCKDRRGLFDPKKSTYAHSNTILHKDFTFIKHFIYYMIKSGCSRFLDSKLLTLDLVYYLFEALRNYPWSYVQLALFKKKQQDDKSIIIDFLIYRLEYFLLTFLNSRCNKSPSSKLQFQLLTVYDDNISRFRSQIQKVIQNFIGIWDIIDAQVPDLQQLNNNLARNLEAINKVKQTYIEVLNLNHNSLELKIMMEIFANHIIYDELLYSKIQDDITLKNKMEVGDSENIDLKIILKGWDMYDQKCFTIEISPQYEKIGAITTFSRNAPKLLGYNDTQLRYQNISLIIPKLMHKHHNNALHTFFETAYDKFVGLPRHLFGIHKEGYVFSMNIIVRVVPTINSFKIIALVHILNEDDYILLDEKGEIDSIGREVQRHTNINHEWLKMMTANIQVFAPKTIEFFQDYWTLTNSSKDELPDSNISLSSSQLGSLKLKKKKEEMENKEKVNNNNENTTEVRKFYIYVPKNSQKLIQKFHEEIKDLQKQTDNLLLSLRENAKKIQGKKAIDKNNKEIERVMLKYKEAYCKKIEVYTKKLSSNDDLERIIKVKASIHTVKLFNEPSLTLKVFKIHSYKIKDPSYMIKVKRLRQEKHMKILERFLIKVSKKLKVFEEEDSGLSDHELTKQESPEYTHDDLFFQQGDEEDKQRRKDLLQFFSKTTTNVNGDSSKKLLSKETTKQKTSLNSAGFNEDFLENRDKGNRLTTLVALVQKNNTNKVRSKTSLGTGIFLQNEGEGLEKKDSSSKLKSKETLGDIKKNPSRVEDNSAIGKIQRRASALKSILKKKRKTRQETVLLDPNNAEAPPREGRNSLLGPQGLTSGQIADWLKNQLKKKVKLVRASILDVTTKKNITGDGKSNILNTSSSDDSALSAGDEKVIKASLDTGDDMKNKNEKQHILEVREKLRGGREQIKEINGAASVGSSTGSLLAYKNISRYLREALDRQEIPLVLRISNICLYLLILLVILLTLISTILLDENYKKANGIISSIKSPSDYGFDFIIAFDSYLDFQLKADNVLNSSLYDDIWFNNQKTILKDVVIDLKKMLDYASNPTNASLRSSTLLYDISNFQITIENEPISIDLNFEKFISLVTNAINQTISFNLTQLNNTNNEFIFILTNNFLPLCNFINQQLSIIQHECYAEIDNINQKILLDLLLNIICLFFGFLLIFPVNMRARLAIEAILVLFTKLSKRDTEYYSRHYKLMRLTWNASGDNYNRLQRDVLEDIKAEGNRESFKQASSIGRSTMHKGMRASYMVFLMGSFTSLSIFVVMICLRNVPLLVGVHKFKSFADMYIDISTTPYDKMEIYEGYKFMLSNSIINASNYNKDNFNLLEDWILTYKYSYVLPDSLYDNNIAQITSETSSLTEDFMFEDICNNFTAYIKTNATFCTSLVTMLNQGFRGFDDVSRSYFELNYDIMYDDYINNYPLNIDIINEHNSFNLNDQYLKDYKLSWIEIKDAFEYWLSFVLSELIQLSINQLNLALQIMIIYFVLLVLFLVLVWRWQYKTLEKSIKRTNEYFTLIPNTLLKENQYIRLYLQRTLGVKALNS